MQNEALRPRLEIALLIAMLVLPYLLGKGEFSMAKADASDGRAQAHESTTPPARDPNVAVEEEYRLARRQNTVQALELFIARHPDHPLAARARADLRLLSR